MHKPQDVVEPNARLTDNDVLSITQLNDLTRRPKEQSEANSQFGSLVNVERLWRQLLFTVHHPAVLDKHLTATCNAICYVVRALANTSDVHLRDFFCSDAIWMECFGAARSAFSASKTKPALQVLETLAYLVKHDTVGASMSIGLPAAAAEMVRIIFTQRPKKSLKDACIILYFFLRKLSDSFSFPEVLNTVFAEIQMSFLYFCRASNITYNPAYGNADSNWVAFILSLLMIMPVADSKTAVLKLLSLICTNSVRSESETVNLVRKAIEVYGGANEKALEDITTDVFPSIISTTEQFYAFLPESLPSNTETPAKVNLMLSQIRLGLQKGYVAEADLPSLLCDKLSVARIDMSNGNTCHEAFTLLLSSADADIRQNACELLLSSISLKTANMASRLDGLMKSLPALHDDNNAYHRGETYSTFRRFLLRIYQRLAASANSTPASQEGLFTVLDEFLGNYIEFLVAELEPSLSYSRHILALDILCFIAKTIEPEKSFLCASTLSDIASQKALFRLVLDPYDDIRETAVTALSYLRKIDQKSFLVCMREIHPLETTCQLAAATNRADHADALGRLIALLSNTSLDTTYPVISADYVALISVSETAKSLEAYVRSLHGYQVSSQYALHGIILGISYSLAIAETLSSLSHIHGLQASLLSLCRQIWALSQTHLCIDSPEVELDIEQEENADFGPKDVLAYAWRALRDCNVLMQAMLNNLAITSELLDALGSMCFEQLCLLRHRGAFSTVAQTFLLCCQKARQHSSESGAQLIEGWFDRALLEVESQADKLTRRSAGLPALFTALLDPQHQYNFLARFNVLVRIAERDVLLENTSLPQSKMRLPQVHALNCIKDIVANSRFRNMTEPFVMHTVNLAAKCMGSQIWAIKNCGLMLLRASINRLDPDTSLGASEAGLATRSQVSAGKTPLDVAVFLLTGMNQDPIRESKTQSTAQTEAEFAGLDLLGRLYIRENDTDRVRRLITMKLGHPLWHIRAQAARLLVRMTQAGEELQFLERIAVNFKQAISINEIHGNFLVLRETILRDTRNLHSEEFVQQLSLLLASLRPCVELTDSEIVLATWLNLINRIREILGSTELDEILEQVMGSLKSRSDLNADLFASLREEMILHLLLSCGGDEAGSTVSAIEAFGHDENIAINVINRLAEKPMTEGILALLTKIVSAEFTDTVRAHAMNAICFHQQKDSDMPLDVMALAQALDFTSLVSRNLFLSQLKLFSCLIQHAGLKSHAALKENLRGLSPGFCLHLRSAAHDEYEEATRLTAIDTILYLTNSSSTPAMSEDVFDGHSQLEILSVLYDLLNDDDEDIRQSAVEATARFSKPSHQRAGIVSRGNAFAARKRLRGYMLQGFVSDVSLQHECLRRILGWESDVPIAQLGHSLHTQANNFSIDQALEVIAAASNDLFAEEKQNLYIDEHAEVKAWAEMCCVADTRLNDDLIVSLQQWAERGIRVLIQYLDTLQEANKICYDLTLELLTVRTVTVARLMGTREEELKILKANCLKTNLPVSVLNAFDWSLQRPSQNS